MATVNEVLFDEAVAHQIGLARYGNGVAKKVIKLLDQVDADLVEQIAALKQAGGWTAKMARLNAVLENVRTINKEAYAVAGSELTDDLIALAETEVDTQAAVIAGALPVRFKLHQPTAEMLKAAVTARPFQGALLKEWVAGMESGRFDRLKKGITAGYVEGEPTDVIVQRVVGTKAAEYKDGILEVSRRSARAIVHTAISHTAHTAKETFYGENADLIKGVRWVSTLDTRTSPICQLRDGKLYAPNKGPRPPAHVNCRSTTVPVTKSFAELGIPLKDLPPGTRASMDGQVPADLTYEEWLKKQPAARQDEVLGKVKAEMFRQGMPLGKFVADTEKSYTLEQLTKLHGKAAAKAKAKVQPKPEPVPEPPVYTKVGPASGIIGGIHYKEFWEDQHGNRYLFKPAEPGLGWIARGEEFASRVGKAVDRHSIEVDYIELEGKPGSLQPWQTGVSGFKQGTDPASLAPGDLAQFQREHVIDWAIANHDSHIENFLRDKDGNVVGIDKGQALKWLGQDKLDVDYHPNQYPEFANTIWKAARDGKIDPDLSHTYDAIARVEAIPDTEWTRWLRPYAEGRFKGDQAKVDAFIALSLKRKHSIRTDFDKFFDDLGVSPAAKLKKAQALLAAQKGTLAASINAAADIPEAKAVAAPYVAKIKDAATDLADANALHAQALAAIKAEKATVAAAQAAAAAAALKQQANDLAKNLLTMPGVIDSPKAYAEAVQWGKAIINDPAVAVNMHSLAVNDLTKILAAEAAAKLAAAQAQAAQAQAALQAATALPGAKATPLAFMKSLGFKTVKDFESATGIKPSSLDKPSNPYKVGAKQTAWNDFHKQFQAWKGGSPPTPAQVATAIPQFTPPPATAHGGDFSDALGFTGKFVATFGFSSKAIGHPGGFKAATGIDINTLPPSTQQNYINLEKAFQHWKKTGELPKPGVVTPAPPPPPPPVPASIPLAQLPVPTGVPGVTDLSTSYPPAVGSMPALRAAQKAADLPMTPQSQNSSVQFYVGTGYASLNRKLRSGGTPTGSEAAHVLDLDNLVRSGRVKNDLVVYRGVSGVAKWANLAPGDVIAEDGYGSHSFNPGVSFGFSGRSKESILFRVLMKKGTQAHHVSRRDTMDAALKDEAEILTPRGTQYRVIAVTWVKAGYGDPMRVIDVEII